MKGRTYYLGNGKYAVSLLIPKPEYFPVPYVKEKIEWIINATKRDDPEYFFDDYGALEVVLDLVEAEDQIVVYHFICDRKTFRSLLKNQNIGYKVDRGP